MILRSLRQGDIGQDVAEWQTLLGIISDGVFGPKTTAATKSFQARNGLDPDGIVGALTLTRAQRAPTLPPGVPQKPYPFSQARNCGPARPGGKVDLIVIHTMEAPEKPGTARAVAEWFGGPDAPQASAHYCVDDAAIVQCVPEGIVAWAAPGANRNGMHIEHAGYAAQTVLDWDDDYSRAVLANSVILAADLAARYAIPVVRLPVEQLAGGGRGFGGHRDVTNALNGGKGHQDPGPNFPWDRYLAAIEATLDPPTRDDLKTLS